MEIAIFVWIMCGIITGSIAQSKGRNPVGWGVVGVLLGIFGVIWIALMSPLDR